MVDNIGEEALIPNLALRPFAPVIGEWLTTGSHPYLPGRPLHGRCSFEWHQGGAFVLMHSEVDAPEIPSGVAVFGSDNSGSDGNASLFMLYFDERGVSRKYDVTITDRLLSWEMLEPGFSQRSTLEFDGTGTRMGARGEMSRDGAPWEADLSLDYVRIDS